MLTIVIPTFLRGKILCETIAHLLALAVPADEIVVVDQSPRHDLDVETRLRSWSEAGAIHLIQLETPSIPRAMNAGLRAAAHDLVLFLDDDVIPGAHLVAAHREAFRDRTLWAVVGQVLQPGEEPSASSPNTRRTPLDLDFPFHSDMACDVRNVMAGNLCVDRKKIRSIEGFDENFIGVAYRFETDFAQRILAAGGRIRFEPAASIRHLKAPGGGTRTWGDHRSSASPMHSVGDYYFALRHVRRFWPYVFRRLRSNVLTRFHLRKPWLIVPKLVGELRGLMLARRLAGEASSSRRLE